MRESAAVNRVDTISEAYSHRLVVIAMIASLATLLIATIYPSGKPADELMSLSFTATYFWIAAQSFALTLPGLLSGILLGSLFPRVGTMLGALMILAVPTVVLLDVLTFTWIAERFLSGTMTRIATSLAPALMLHVTSSAMYQGILVSLSAVVAGWLAWKTSGAVATKWVSREDAIQPLPTTMVLSMVAVLTSSSAIRSYSVTVDEMSRSSTRHPFCAFRLVGYRGVGVAVPSEEGAVLSRLRGLQSIEQVQAREKRQLTVSVDAGAFEPDLIPEDRRKVIVVVVECLRPEVIDPVLMPNLHRFAQKSILCRNNFSGGNSTCLSMFSLVNGVEAIWFRRKLADDPVFNRLLHQAGYQLGFFGGQIDWALYEMDGFIHPDHYEQFVIEQPRLPETDLNAVERTMRFIDQAPKESRPLDASESPQVFTTAPRAAVCYLFGTHSSFRYSEPEFRLFEPEAEEGLLISHSPELKEQFYNRYKNSLRSMDRTLAPLLRDDCVVLVMGDHGEPFLDDGTAVHGTRLSRFQNMTPAVIYYPGVEPRHIDLPTFHADLLPTLLSILEIPITDSTVFDGLDLIGTDDETLSRRTFVSRNFLDTTSMLVGPWTLDPAKPFGYRVAFDIWDWQTDYLNPIDEFGYEWGPDSGESDASQGEERFRQWVANRFGEAATGKDRSERALFEQFFDSDDDETRLAVLQIASSVVDPGDELYERITEAASDPVPQIRDLARELIIRINRYRGAAAQASSDAVDADDF